MRERLKDFFEVYEFFLKTGNWTTNSVFGVMQEAYREINGPDARLNTGCSGCVAKAAKEIYERWH